MAKPRQEPKRVQIIRIPELLYVDVITFCPEMLSPAGGMRYGAINNYITQLIREDIAKRKEAVRKISA